MFMGAAYGWQYCWAVGTGGDASAGGGNGCAGVGVLKAHGL